MSCLNMIIVFLVFFAVSGLVLYLYYQVERWYGRYVVLKRLSSGSRDPGGRQRQKAGAILRKTLHRLGEIARPRTDRELADLKVLLSYAGFRNPGDPVLFFGVRLGLGLLMGFIYLLALSVSDRMTAANFMLIFFFIGFGYYLPVRLLRQRIKSRHGQISRELPDVLDLLLVCMEAGLSFDMAFLRVSRELSRIAPVLSKEFSQYFFEIKSGLPRTEVLLNLAKRNGEEGLDSVVQVLTQSFRFGTDIAASLRVYSEALRTERLQKAEVRSAGISVKLTFVTILLILPAYLLIVLGPTIIRIREVLFS
ncbi:MAG: type II secretion system F family protein [Deltaproteobacteria bacterium]|nr:type II secretion system F family protein [Deltaproteobacteria bacterium]MBW2102162.1 type II secretion system F family protein [Deltaproteobacteria bacterium]RLC10586.1 MAG: type II secretion system F family protein [Deltaproteobacteria bacterium]